MRLEFELSKNKSMRKKQKFADAKINIHKNKSLHKFVSLTVSTSFVMVVRISNGF